MTIHIYGDQLMITQSIASNAKILLNNQKNLQIRPVRASFVNNKQIEQNDLIIFLENTSFEFNLKWLHLFDKCGAKVILLRDNLQTSNLKFLFENGLKFAITTFDSNLIFRDVLLAAINNHPSYYSPIMLNRLINPIRRHTQSEVNQPFFTDKEAKLISLFWNEKNKHSVAEEMNISVRTVESYRSKLISKMNKNSFLGVVKHAIKNGLLN